MTAPKYPMTLAIRALRAAGVSFEPHLYPWEAHGGTAASAAALGVGEHNGGARGFLVAIDPKDAQRVLSPTLVDVAIVK